MALISDGVDPPLLRLSPEYRAWTMLLAPPPHMPSFPQGPEARREKREAPKRLLGVRYNVVKKS